jgi:intein/homing endonuclease
MKRLGSRTLEEVFRLYGEAKSLRSVARETGLSRSTIYYHVRKRFGRRIVQLVFNTTPNIELGEFLGLFAADGCFYIDKKRYHYTLTITLSKYQLPYARIVQRMMERIIGKKPRIDMKDKSIQLVARGKPILSFLHLYLCWKGRRTYSIHFRSPSLRLGTGFQRGILRGLIAGDGNVYPPKRRVSFGVVSKSLAQQFLLLLRKFGIAAKMYSVEYTDKRTLYHVHFSGLEKLKKFKLRVGLTDPAKDRQLGLALRP